MSVSFRGLSVSERATIPLSRTLFFWLSSVTFISLDAPMLANWMRGLVGFFPLVGLAVLMGTLEGSFDRVLRSISRGFSANKWMALFAVWYLIGVSLNIFFRSEGLGDWRLTMGPVVLLIAMCFAFGFMRYEDCFRFFQVMFILIVGTQAIFTVRELSSEAGIARVMWMELQGAWIFGNQGEYATWAILLPVLLWRAWKERGVLRLLLLVAAIFIGVAASISAFATPVALVGLAGVVVSILLVFFPPKGQKRLTSVIIVVILLIIGIALYQMTYENPLFASAFYRIENALRDPQSGGYSGSDLAGSRWYLTEISIRSFLKDPLLGAGGGSTRHSQFVGGHSSFFDALGAYGLLGGGGALAGMIGVMLVNAIKRFWSRRDWETLLALVSVVMLVIAGVVNPYWEGWQPVMVLMMARPFQFNSEQTNALRQSNRIGFGSRLEG